MIRSPQMCSWKGSLVRTGGTSSPRDPSSVTPPRRRILTALTVIAIVVIAGVTSCGGTTASVTIASVGRAQITDRDLAEWMTIMAPGHLIPDPPRYSSCIAQEEAHGQQPIGNALREECEAQDAMLKTKALRFLITSNWLIANAKELARAPSDREVMSWLASHANLAMPVHARRLTAERALAGSVAETEVHAREAPIAREQVSRYYARHFAHYERPERRFFDIIENIRTKTEALKVLGKLVHHHLRGIVAIHESYYQPRVGEYVRPSKRMVLKAIFAARPGVYVGPLLLNGYYAVFRVTRSVPRVVQPLTRAQRQIARRLTASQHQRVLARFLAAWQDRWKAVTTCRSKYMIPECKSSNQALASNPSLFGLN
jgi:hypothetical protein